MPPFCSISSGEASKYEYGATSSEERSRVSAGLGADAKGSGRVKRNSFGSSYASLMKVAVRLPSFTVARADADLACDVLEAHIDELGFAGLDVDKHVAKVSIVGAGMMLTSGIAAKMFDALASRKINIDMISTSEIKVSVLVNEEDADRAVQAVHDKFFGD